MMGNSLGRPADSDQRARHPLLGFVTSTPTTASATSTSPGRLPVRRVLVMTPVDANRDRVPRHGLSMHSSGAEVWRCPSGCAPKGARPRGFACVALGHTAAGTCMRADRTMRLAYPGARRPVAADPRARRALVCYGAGMKRTTISLPDDLAQALAASTATPRVRVRVTREALTEHLGSALAGRRASSSSPRSAQWRGQYGARYEALLDEEWRELPRDR